MASYKWVRDRAIPYLKKNPGMPATELQKELEEKYQVTIGYPTVHLGRECARDELFGTWEESFGYLINFKAEIEHRMPGSVVEKGGAEFWLFDQLQGTEFWLFDQPPGSSKGGATPSPSKRQKVEVAKDTSGINNSPGPVTRRQSQLQLTMGELGGTSQITTTSKALTTSQTGEGPSNTMTTPRKSPRKRQAIQKKLTPRKRKNMDA